MEKSGRHISLSIKLTVFVFLVVIVSVGSVGAFSYLRFYQTTLETNQRIARMFAESQAHAIDGDKYEATVASGEKDEYWYALKSQTDEIKIYTDMAYISLLSKSAPYEIVYFLDGEKPGDDPDMICDFLTTDVPESYDHEKLTHTMETGETTWSQDTYSAGRYGALIAGYAAIRNSNGDIVGVVSCDVDVNDAIAAANQFGLYIVAAAAAACVMFIMIGLIFINLTVRKPLKQLSYASKRLTAGDLEMRLTLRSSDELGVLARDFKRLAGTLHTLASETNEMTAAHSRGEMDRQIDATPFAGAYLSVANGLNEMAANYRADCAQMAEAVLALGTGQFDFKPHTMPGQKKKMSDAVHLMRDNLRSVNEEILGVVALAQRGTLNRRIDAERYAGGWKELAEAVNDLLKSVSVPIDEAVSVLGDIAAGKLDRRIEGAYEGDFDKIKHSVNDMCGNISSYIAELSNVLRNVVNNRLDVCIQGDFVGQFVDLKVSVNSIVTHLNDVFGRLAQEMQSVSASILQDASNLTCSGDALASTSHTQSDAIGDLLDDVHMISGQLANMSDNASAATELTFKARESANIGDERMRALLAAMDTISASSEKIMQVIQVIDDIAFQTNLLALNAAVEAAHAGKQGRGFMVVADHVRNLANRSKESAVESAGLIEESMEEIRQGMAIAQKAGAALKVIVENVEQVCGCVENISQSTLTQANAIQTINAAMDILNTSVSDSSETSEEIAAIARGLSNRSSEMNSLLLELE